MNEQGKKIFLRGKAKASAASLCAAGLVCSGFAGIAGFAAPQESFAADGSAITTGNETGSITVNGLQAGDVVNVYKIVDINYATSTKSLNYNYVSAIGADGVTVNGTKYTIEKYAELKDKLGSANAGSVNEDTRAVASALEAKVVGGTPTKSGTVANGATSVKIDGLALGQYAVTVQSAHQAGHADGNPQDRVYQAMTATVNAKANGTAGYVVEGANVNAKYTTEKIVKKTKDGTNGQNQTDSDTTDDYSIGDSVPFTVTTTVPVFSDSATNKTFEVGDKMESGLTFNGSVKVAVGATALAEGTDYTYAADGNGYKIKFVYDKIKKYAGQDITLSYSATVNSSAAVNGNGDKNKVTLTYASNPYSNSNQEDTDETTTYTYGIQIKKVDKTDANKVLSNAKFGVYSDAQCKNLVTWAADNSKGIKAFDGTITTDDTGYAYVTGLKEGTYYYKELTAPAGYQVDTQVRSFTVSKATATQDNKGTAGVTEKNYVAEGVVQDTPNIKLPITGGQGVLMLGGAAAVLVIGGVAIKLRNRRNDEDDEE